MDSFQNLVFSKHKYQVFGILLGDLNFSKFIRAFSMLCCCSLFFQSSLSAQCVPDTQYDVLVEIYNSNNASSPNPLGWDLNDCDYCNWNGVTCINGQITKLDLSNKQLTVLPAEIGQLNSLIELILTNNQLITLPLEIGQLSNLDKFVISNNQITFLPAEIGQLTNLKLLEVNHNNLTALPTEIGNLSALINLSLVNNQITFLPAEFGQLSNLWFFNALQNELFELPEELGQLTNLMFLNLGNNQLSCLPTEISNLYNNTWLIGSPDFSNNPNLPFGFTFEEFYNTGIGTCCVSTDYDATQHNVLTTIFNENPLSQTALGWNIYDCDYCNWEGVSCNTSGQVTILNISNKQLTSLPIEILQLNNLIDLDVSNNDLSCFPIELSAFCNNSLVPNVANNPLLPTTFTWGEFCSSGLGACCPFTYFDSAQYNALVAIYYANDATTQSALGWNLNDCHYYEWNGVTCNQMGQVTELNFENVQLTSIPTQIDFLNSLTHLNFNNNQLTSLPIEIANLSNLVELQVDNNQLSCLPEEFNTFCSVPFFTASFDNNPNMPSNFSWEIFCTTGYGSCCQIDNLDPTQYEALTAIYFANSPTTQNYLNWDLSNCNYCTWFGVLCNPDGTVRELSLSNKQLTTIPAEIGLLTNLERIVFFNNQLTSLPTELYSLTNLNSLNIGINQFTSLPAEIGQLTNLQSLVAFNNQIDCLPEELNVMCNNGSSPPLLFGNPLPPGFNWNTFCSTGLGSSTRYYEDSDLDGYGNPNVIQDACEQPIGFVLNNTDCNDNDANINAPQPYFIDADNDGFGSTETELVCSNTPLTGYALNNTDCNDNDSTVNTPQPFYIDADGDGFGSDSIVMFCNSTPPTGYSNNNTDCNDNDSTVYTPQSFFVDADGDGFGSDSIAMFCNSTPPAGYADNNSDCNDLDSLIHPNAIEICDNIDNNCDGQIDENLTCSTPYCEAAGQNNNYEWIESIAINNNTHTSGNNNGYLDNTNIIIPISTGSNSISLTPGFANKKYKEYWVVYIDLNQDGSFESNEIVFYKKSKYQINSNFNIPNTTLEGTTRMRIMMQYGAWSGACNDFNYGEVEDYTVDISSCDNCETDYCLSQGNSTNYEYIKKVKLQDINNNSGNNNGYADFTHLSTDLYRGQSKSIHLKPGFVNYSELEYWTVWVDWNQDGDFEDSNEQEVRKRSWGNVWGKISVPHDASLGATQMRISMKYGDYAAPCQDIQYGEVEDYTIIVKNFHDFNTASNDELQLVATKKNNDVQLDWINNTGYKNDYFVIEKSMDGKSFTPIAESENKRRDNETKAYSEIDTQPEEGRNMYRIKLVLENGEIMYSEVKSADFGYNPNTINLYPNPTVEEVFINLKDYQGKNAHIMLSNSFGQVLYQTNLEDIHESNFRISLSGYDAGQYNMSIKIEGRSRINKPFIVTKL